MDSSIVAIIVLMIVGLAALYVVNAKKRGEKCIGCPYAKECAKKGESPCGGQKG